MLVLFTFTYLIGHTSAWTVRNLLKLHLHVCFKCMLMPFVLQAAGPLDINSRAFVISGVEDRWVNTNNTLFALGIRAQRVIPVAASLANARVEFKKYPCDAHVDILDSRKQRQLALRATFMHIFKLISKLPEVAEDDFVMLFEDDIVAHAGVKPRAFAEAYAHGKGLAAEDGLLYLGACGPDCNESIVSSFQKVQFMKCASYCTHAFAIKKHKARLMDSLFYQDLVKHPQYWPECHAIDLQLLRHSLYNNLTWVLGTNLKSPQVLEHVGVFYQDRSKFTSLINI